VGAAVAISRTRASPRSHLDLLRIVMLSHQRQQRSESTAVPSRWPISPSGQRAAPLETGPVAVEAFVA